MQNRIELRFLKILFLHISGIFLEFFLVFFEVRKLLFQSQSDRDWATLTHFSPSFLFASWGCQAAMPFVSRTVERC